MAAILQTTFHVDLLKYHIFIKGSQYCCRVFNSYQTSVGSDNDLVLNKR